MITAAADVEGGPGSEQRVSVSLDQTLAAGTHNVRLRRGAVESDVIAIRTA